MIWRILTILCTVLAAVGARADDRRLRVAVSVAPVHSLVAGVMAGAGSDPELLIDAALSPHSFALKPSQARFLARADVVIWLGGTLESPLRTAINTLPSKARVVTLIDAPTLQRLALRRRDTSASRIIKDGGGTDPHLWLDPENAIAIVRLVSRTLQNADPGQAALYAKNAALSEARIRNLDGVIKNRLAPLRAVPFIVFHDAYQYFEHRYGLNDVGVVRAHPEQTAGARSMRDLAHDVAVFQVQCLFAEPQYDDSAIKAFAGKGPKVRVLDPLGQGLPPGPGLYEAMMLRLTDTLAGCLGATLDEAGAMP